MSGELIELDNDAAMERLGARAAARSLLLAMAAAEPAQATTISRVQLWEHANRASSAPVSFAVERALRSDPVAMSTYRRMLAIQSVGISERAAAAYAGGPFKRKLKGALIEIIEEDGAPPALMITLDAGVKEPRFIEIVALEGCVRRVLPAATDGHIILDLPRTDAELDLMRILLANPDAGVYLIV
jgi:hypothetical protein